MQPWAPLVPCVIVVLNGLVRKYTAYWPRGAVCLWTLLLLGRCAAVLPRYGCDEKMQPSYEWPLSTSNPVMVQTCERSCTLDLQC